MDSEIVNDASAMWMDVYSFMAGCQQHIGKHGQEMPQDVRDLRCRLIKEEHDELIEALGNGDDVGTVDGVIDLIYVALGTLVSMGIPDLVLWREIHDNNMRKLNRGRIEGGKLDKPADHEGPELEFIMDQYLREG